MESKLTKQQEDMVEMMSVQQASTMQIEATAMAHTIIGIATAIAKEMVAQSFTKASQEVSNDS